MKKTIYNILLDNSNSSIEITRNNATKKLYWDNIMFIHVNNVSNIINNIKEKTNYVILEKDLKNILNKYDRGGVDIVLTDGGFFKDTILNQWLTLTQKYVINKSSKDELIQQIIFKSTYH